MILRQIFKSQQTLLSLADFGQLHRLTDFVYFLHSAPRLINISHRMNSYKKPNLRNHFSFLVSAIKLKACGQAIIWKFYISIIYQKIDISYLIFC